MSDQSTMTFTVKALTGTSCEMCVPSDATPRTMLEALRVTQGLAYDPKIDRYFCGRTSIDCSPDNTRPLTEYGVADGGTVLHIHQFKGDAGHTAEDFGLL